MKRHEGVVGLEEHLVVQVGSAQMCWSLLYRAYSVT